MSNIEIMEKGMSCLLEKLGAVETEIFISVILREKFDYTKWQRQHFDPIALQELNRQAVEFEQQHPFDN